MRQQASVKISKQKNHENKRQLNNLMRVLRPKVYITESSNFKRLVQELTGNNTGSYTSTVQLPPPLTRTAADTELHDHESINNISVPVIDCVNIEEDGDGCCPSSMEAYSFQFCNNVLSSDYNQIMYSLNDDGSTFDFDMLKMKQDWSAAYQDLESWLLDIDHHHQSRSNFDGFVQNEEAVSTYSYELSGLI
ncbi:VQ motif containing protein [Melia azedarach]|uniref:VQ motif containing protein n=1 Tax=Melia azedarach TaxID=155640 RepID=A0ACC1Z0W4_MELAZ|nr:VQ motif containing protein [Melia azedarach]